MVKNTDLKRLIRFEIIYFLLDKYGTLIKPSKQEDIYLAFPKRAKIELDTLTEYVRTTLPELTQRKRIKNGKVYIESIEGIDCGVVRLLK